MRILMIEDDEQIGVAVKANIEFVLEDEFANVEVTATLDGATACLSECVYDLILLDISLPDGNGLRWLQEQQAIKRQGVPVLVLSSHQEINIVRLAIELGVVHYLDKSIQTLVELPRLIEETVYARRSHHHLESAIPAIEAA